MQPIIGKFYKYRPICEEGSEKRKRLYDIVVNCELYHSNPAGFNDPYDCHPIAVIPDRMKDPEYLLEYGKRILLEEKVDLTGVDVEHTVNNMMKDFLSSETRTRQMYESINETLAVCSLSETPHSSPQWAYYADSQKGVCFEFDICTTDVFQISKVDYSKIRPSVEVDLSEMGGKAITIQLVGAVTTKSIEWDHEMEVRSLKDKRGPYKFPPNILTKVIFGLEAPSDYQEYVMSLVDASECEPEIYNCVMNTKSYELGSERIR